MQARQLASAPTFITTGVDYPDQVFITAKDVDRSNDDLGTVGQDGRHAANQTFITAASGPAGLAIGSR